MARRLTRSLCLALLLAGCASAGQQAARAPSAHERLRLAAAAEANNNLEVALSIYRNAAQAEPDNPEVQARYARALADRGAHAEAVLVLEQALARRPRERTLLLALGRTQLRANDLRTAGQTFQRLLEQAPGDPDALNGMGVIADISGEHELAQERYREGLRRAPAHEGLRNNLALSLALTGATGEAKEVLQRLRRDGNTDVRVRHNLALVSAMAGDDAAARRLSAAELDAVEQQQLVAAASLLAAAGRSAPPAAAPAPRPESSAPPPTSAPAPSAPIEPPPAPVAAAPPRAEPPGRAEAPARVLLRARAETWVHVREQETGSVVFDRVLQAGESYRVPDRAGLLLTTGNAPALEVLVDGEPLPALGGTGRVRRDIPLDPAAMRQLAAAQPPRGPAPPAVAPSVPPAPQAAPAAEATPARVVLGARRETWVQVHERAGGSVLFDRVMQPGETYRVPDRPGLLLTTGNAGGLEVQVEGEVLPPLGAERAVRRDMPLEAAALRRLAAARVETPAPPVAVAPPPAAPPAAPRVLLRAREQTWVLLRAPSSGQVVLDRVLGAGETFAVPDRPDLVMTVGNAAGLQVVLDGETLPALGGEGVVRRNIPLDPAGLRAATAPRAPSAEPAAAAAPMPAEGAPARIVLRARDETWVQVRERDSGTVLFDRVLRAGEQYEVPARSGLLLTTGNAGGLEVSVEGEVLPPLGADRAVRRDVPLEPAALRRAVVVGAR